MLNIELLNTLVRPFGISDADLEFIQHSQNIVYRQLNRKRVIRISKERYRTESQTKAELDWVNYLAKQNISVCRPVPTENGQTFLSCVIEGVHYIVSSFEHAPGLAALRQDADEVVFEKLGALNGKMHQTAKSFATTGHPLDRLMCHESRLLNEDFLEFKQSITPKFRDSILDMISELNEGRRTPESFGLTHGDINFVNFYQDNGELWIYDFDNCEYGYHLQDLATTLYDSIYCKVLNKFADEGLNSRIKFLWGPLLKGYLINSPSKAVDTSRLKKFFILREAIIYVHYHRTLNVEELGDSFHRGLEVMRLNVENQTHQVDFAAISNLKN